MRSQRQTNFFTLVEVLIAMGVCVIGICSIMVFFPIGANASRNAAMASYAEDVAYQLLHFAKDAIEKDNDANSTNDFFAFHLFTGGWVASNPNGFTPQQPAQSPSNNSLSLGSGTTKTVFDNLFKNNSTDVEVFDNRVFHFRIMPSGVSRSNLADFKATYSDFDCYASLYAKPIKNGPGANDNIPFAARLYVEVTWPAELPYQRRQKKTYSMDVFKQY